MLVDLHCRLALSSIFYSFVVGLWAGAGFLLRRGVHGNLFGALAVGELVFILQGILGLILIAAGGWPRDSLHFLYGVVIAITWPGVFAYTHGGTGTRERGFYALASFFITGLALRAMTTGAAAAVCLPR